MRAQIVLAQVARPSLDVADLRARSDGEPDPRADRLGVGAGATPPAEPPVRAFPAVISQELGVLSIVADEQIEIAVVVDVAHGQPPAHTLGGERRTRRPPDFAEAARRRV